MGKAKQVLKAIFQRFNCPKCGCPDVSGSYPELWMCHNRKCNASNLTEKGNGKGKQK